jgi:hypothetical protein
MDRKSPVDPHIGRRLKEYRQHRGMTVRELADAAHATPGQEPVCKLHITGAATAGRVVMLMLRDVLMLRDRYNCHRYAKRIPWPVRYFGNLARPYQASLGGAYRNQPKDERRGIAPQNACE